jgi:Predicted secreted hydrolase
MALQINRANRKFAGPAMVAAVLVGIYLIVVGFIYQLALPGRKLTFPAAHYSHPDFKTEWWYYTGHLQPRAAKSTVTKLLFFVSGCATGRRKQKSRRCSLSCTWRILRFRT